MTYMDLGIVDADPFRLRIGTGTDIEEVNLPLFPAHMYIKTSEIFKKHKSILEITFDETVDFLVETLGKENPKITKEFLITKCTGSQVSAALMVFIQRFLSESLPESTKSSEKTESESPNP